MVPSRASGRCSRVARSRVLTPPGAVRGSGTGLPTPCENWDFRARSKMLGSIWAKGAADAGRPAACGPACGPVCAREQHGEAEASSLLQGGEHSGSSSGPSRALPCLLPMECPSWEPLTLLPHPRGPCAVLSPEMMKTLWNSILLPVDSRALCFFLKGRPRRRVGVSGAGGLWELGLSVPDGRSGTGGFPELCQSLVHLRVRFTLLTPMALRIGSYQHRNSTKATFYKVTTSWWCLSCQETTVCLSGECALLMEAAATLLLGTMGSAPFASHRGIRDLVWLKNFTVNKRTYFQI